MWTSNELLQYYATATVLQISWTLKLFFLLFLITVNNPPTLQGESIFTVNTDEEAVYSFNATDDDEFTVSTMDGVPANGNLIQMGSELNFTFTIPFARQNLAGFSLGFSAQDSEGAVSSLQPQLRICACVNGNCTIEGIADTGANTIVLNCECPEGTVHLFATHCIMTKF